ncbi:hypothetical protein CERSUDRAFT_98507 [Gelatoporia subvermispora B]|uniref:Uncharacterized protein n=1 Tax=Ceriporiopsis subvermispora (strain B) TaxID=914234 RepID=M2R5F0_CERS8|nr:hypothetical protein CERSUDRAFT_98507 [Gelatoporia subvermispora B]
MCAFKQNKLLDFTPQGDTYTAAAQNDLGEHLFGEHYYINNEGPFSRALTLAFVKQQVILAWDRMHREIKRDDWETLSRKAYMRILAWYGSQEEVDEMESRKDWLLVIMQAMGAEVKGSKAVKKSECVVPQSTAELPKSIREALAHLASTSLVTHIQQCIASLLQIETNGKDDTLCGEAMASEFDYGPLNNWQSGIEEFEKMNED